MKFIKNKITDSGREYLQILSLFVCFCLPTIANVSEIIRTILGGQELDFETAKYYYLMLSGNWIIGFLLMVYVLFNFFRKSNKETILNKGNVYHRHTYTWYLFCSKVLGYDKCNLVLVPIYMQFKLILADTFKEYPLNESLFMEKNYNIQITKNITPNMTSKVFNVVIEDTYPIEDNQIPEEYLELNMIRIKRTSNKVGERVYCRDLIDSVVEEIRLLPEDSTINVFATTNPKNTYEIVKKGLCLADRSNIKRVNVFQQKGFGKREFEKKSYTVLNNEINN